MKKYFLIIVLSLLSMVVFSCSLGKKEVIVYTTFVEGDTMDRILGVFNKDYPDIKVRYVADSMETLTSRVIAEGDHIQADIVLGVDNLSIANHFKRVDVENQSNIRSDFIENPYYYLSVYKTVLAVNKKLLEEKGLPMPMEYEDLIKPIYKGQFVMPNPVSSGTGYSFVSRVISDLGFEEGFKFFDALNKNVAMYTSSGSAPLNHVNRGEYAIGLTLDFDAILKKTQEVELIFPKKYSGYSKDGLVLVDKKKIKEEALILYNWLMGNNFFEIQATFRTILGTDKVKVKLDIPDDYTMVVDKKYDLFKVEKREDIFRIWNEKYQ